MARAGDAGRGVARDESAASQKVDSIDNAITILTALADTTAMGSSAATVDFSQVNRSMCIRYNSHHDALIRRGVANTWNTCWIATRQNTGLGRISKLKSASYLCLAFGIPTLGFIACVDLPWH